MTDPATKPLNTADLEKALTYVVSRGGDHVTESDFQFLFDAKAKAAGLIAGNEVLRDAAAALGSVASTGTNKDTAVTAKDLVALFDKNMALLDANAGTLDQFLPFAGQCAFGMFVGYGCGYVARSLFRYKVPIALLGFGGYSGLQYLAQQDYVNREVMMAEFQKRVATAFDVNGDGRVTREDLETLIDHRMAIVNKKLGPGGFAPGLAGYATFSAGFMLALRRRRH